MDQSLPAVGRPEQCRWRSSAETFDVIEALERLEESVERLRLRVEEIAGREGPARTVESGPDRSAPGVRGDGLERSVEQEGRIT
jgi:hypothetical protein